MIRNLKNRLISAIFHARTGNSKGSARNTEDQAESSTSTIKIPTMSPFHMNYSEVRQLAALLQVQDRRNPNPTFIKPRRDDVGASVTALAEPRSCVPALTYYIPSPPSPSAPRRSSHSRRRPTSDSSTCDHTRG